MGHQKKGPPRPKQPVLNLKHKNLKYKLAALMIDQFGQFCMMDHDNACYRYLASRFAGPVGRDHREAAEQRATAGARLRWWPQVVALVYLYTSIKFTISSYFHFMFTIYRDQLEALNGEDGDQHDELNRSLESTRAILDAVGAPYLEGGVATSCGYLILVLVTVDSYLLPALFFNLNGRLATFVNNLLLDKAQEDSNYCTRLIEGQLATVLNSGKNLLEYLDALYRTEVCHRPTPTTTTKHNKPGTTSSLTERTRVLSHLNRKSFADKKLSSLARLDSELNKRFANELLAGDKLRPFNRRPESIEKLVNHFIAFACGNILWSFIQDMSLTFWVPRVAGFPCDLSTWPNVISIIEMLLLAEINVISTSYFLALFTGHCHNQNEYIIDLRRQLCECIVENERDYALFLQESWQEQENRIISSSSACQQDRERDIREKINRRLLLIIMRYRIFLSQLGQVKYFWAFTAFIGLNLMFVIPFIVRLYAPYLPHADRQAEVLAGISFSVSAVLLVDSFFYPLFTFAHQGALLYRNLWSLYAHTLSVNETSASLEPNSWREGPIYSFGLVGILRRSLQGGKQVVAQFETSLFGLKITFGQMIELHFYYSLVCLSHYYEIRSWRLLLGDRLDDPFRLHRPRTTSGQ